MVTSVSGSSSASALIRDRSSQSAPTRDDISTFARDLDSSKKASETSRTKETREGITATEKPTELKARNDDQTLQTEQTRGSLLDMAV